MKPETSTGSPRTKKYLVSCLAALMAVSAPMGYAADSEALKKLQEENAALRKRLAALEGAPAAAPTAPSATAPSTGPVAPAFRPSMQGDEGVQTLSAFEVKTDKDNGYLKTNAATATKIGMEIQKIPLNVSVISREFLNDTNAQSLTDLFRYTAAASGDTRFAMRIPANSATPQGTFTMRGFVVNSLMRNGIFRYASYNLDTVERVEGLTDVRNKDRKRWGFRGDRITKSHEGILRPAETITVSLVRYDLTNITTLRDISTHIFNERLNQCADTSAGFCGDVKVLLTGL
jgi:hypothetical protein